MPYKNKRDLYDNQMQRWIKRKEKAISYKGSICMDCKQVYHANVMQFHHRDPTTKLWRWNKLRLRSWADVYIELDKCDLLCANCHILRHTLIR